MFKTILTLFNVVAIVLVVFEPALYVSASSSLTRINGSPDLSHHTGNKIAAMQSTIHSGKKTSVPLPATIQQRPRTTGQQGIDQHGVHVPSSLRNHENTNDAFHFYHSDTSHGSGFDDESVDDDQHPDHRNLRYCSPSCLSYARTHLTCPSQNAIKDLISTGSEEVVQSGCGLCFKLAGSFLVQIVCGSFIGSGLASTVSTVASNGFEAVGKKVGKWTVDGAKKVYGGSEQGATTDIEQDRDFHSVRYV